MKINKICMWLAAATAVCSCEPLEDSNWTGNSLPSLDWQQSVKNVRPKSVEKMTLYYVPYSDAQSHILSFDMPENTAAFDIQSGLYDVFAVSGCYDIQPADEGNEMLLVLPYDRNDHQEKIISTNPNMIYCGSSAGVHCDYLHRIEIPLVMKRATKRLNFVVNVGDEDELNRTCEAELSGMTVKWNLHTRKPHGTEEYTQLFKLTKEGRHWNEQGCLTTYKGYIHTFGSNGKNILTFTFRNAQQQYRTVTTDITPYLDGWNSDEVTIRLAIHIGEDTQLSIEGFEQGNTTDFEI